MFLCPHPFDKDKVVKLDFHILSLPHGSLIELYDIAISCAKCIDICSCCRFMPQKFKGFLRESKMEKAS